MNRPDRRLGDLQLNIYRGKLRRGEDTIYLSTIASDRKEAKDNFQKDYPDFTLAELTLSDGNEGLEMSDGQ